MKYLPLKTKKMYSVPTGNIVVANGEYGLIEYLSIGDYGKDVNLKCDALGLTREIEKVKHVDMMSLEEKWVITISSQYGCSINCNFCDVPKVGMVNFSVVPAAFNDLLQLVRHKYAIRSDPRWL